MRERVQGGDCASVEILQIESTVTLIERIGALGLLIARKRECELTLAEVVYFRLVGDLSRASCFKEVKIELVDGFWVARPADQDDTLFFEPSALPYEARAISKMEFGLWVDSVVYDNLEWIVERGLELFENQLALD